MAVSHLPQVAAEFPLLLALDGEFRDRHGSGGEDAHDGHGDDELDEVRPESERLRGEMRGGRIGCGVVISTCNDVEVPLAGMRSATALAPTLTKVNVGVAGGRGLEGEGADGALNR